MKKHLLTLALGMAPLAHADLSPIEIFKSLAPTQSALAPASTLGTLAGIPADASLVISLPQIPESLVRLQSLMGDEPLPAELQQIGSLVKSASFGISKDGAQALSQLVLILGTLAQYEYQSQPDDDPKVKEFHANELANIRKSKVEAAQKLQSLQLPTLYLVGQIDLKLTPQLVDALAQLTQLMNKLQEAAQNKIPLDDKMFLTSVKPIEHAGMAGYQFEFEIEGVKKAYCLLQQIQGSTVRLIGTPDVAQLKLVGSEQESFLSTEMARNLAAAQDIHFYSAETNPVAKLFDFSLDMQMTYTKQVDAHIKQLKQVANAIAPKAIKGISASMSFAGNPEFQIAWKNDTYRFAPVTFKAASLIKPDAEKVFYAESSPINLPDLGNFIDLMDQHSKGISAYYQGLYTAADEEDYYNKRQKIREERDDMRFAAYKLIWSTASGQASILEQSPKNEFELAVIGFKDKGIMQSAVERIDAAQQHYQAQLEKLEKEHADERAGIIVPQTNSKSKTLTNQALIICGTGVTSEQYEQAKGELSLSGALFMLRERDMTPYSGIYGRLDNVGEDFLVKFQLRRAEKK